MCFYSRFGSLLIRIHFPVVIIDYFFNSPFFVEIESSASTGDTFPARPSVDIEQLEKGYQFFPVSHDLSQIQRYPSVFRMKLSTPQVLFPISAFGGMLITRRIELNSQPLAVSSFMA